MEEEIEKHKRFVYQLTYKVLALLDFFGLCEPDGGKEQCVHCPSRVDPNRYLYGSKKDIA